MRKSMIACVCTAIFSAGCATESRLNNAEGIDWRANVPAARSVDMTSSNYLTYQPRDLAELRPMKGQISITTNSARSLYLRADRDMDEVVAIRVGEGVPESHAVKVGKEPISIVLNGEEKLAYVSNLGDGTVSVIDLSSFSVSDTIKIGANLFCLVFSRGEKYLYVVSRYGDQVWMVDPAVNQVVGTTKIFQMDLDVKKTQCYSGCHKLDPQRQRTFESMRHLPLARVDGDNLGIDATAQ